MQDEGQQLPVGLEDEEAGLREPQVPDTEWEGKTDIWGTLRRPTDAKLLFYPQHRASP